MNWTRCACAWLGIFVFFQGNWGHCALTVEVVDDTGEAHSPYLLLVGKSAAGPGGETFPLSVNAGSGQLALANADEASNSISPLPIDFLESDGTVVSPFSGQTRTLYKFTVNSIGSGAFLIFRNEGETPFVYINNANPDPVTSNFRFDLCELTFNPSIQSGADLTSIDAFSMPMQFELFQGSNKIDERAYYLSTESILTQFENLGLGQALYKVGSGQRPVPGWTSADGLSAFVRVLGPGKIASSNGLPSPFPSFSKYLDSLATASYPFSVSGNANGSNYNYSGTVQTDPDGYKITLTGTTSPPPPPNSQSTPIPPDLPVTINLPTRGNRQRDRKRKRRASHKFDDHKCR